MTASLPVVIQSPIEPSEDATDPFDNIGSTLGRIIEAVCVGTSLVIPKCISPSPEVVSEFAAYESAPVDHNDEPLFALSVGEYCEALPQLIVFANDEGRGTGT